MPGFEILFQAVDEASPAIQKLSKEMLAAAERSDRFAGEIFNASQKADQGLSKIPPKASQAKDSINALQQASQQLTQQLLGFATVAGITAFFKSSADAALEEEEALRRLAFAVDATGNSFDQNKIRILGFAQEQQALTRFSDTETYEALGRLTRVTGDVGQAMQVTRLAFGMASASGKDLNSILDLLGPILNGDASRLRALKNEFGAFIGNADTAQEVISALSSKFLGAAESEKGFAKELATSKNALNDFQETVGGGVLPVFRILLNTLAQGVKFTEVLGLVLANFTARAVVGFEAMGKELQAIFTAKFSRLPEIGRETAARMEAIEEESASMAAEIEKRYSRERIQTIQEEGEIKARVTEESIERANREAEEKKRASQDAHDTIVRLDAEKLDLEENHLESKRILIEMEKQERFRQLDELKEKGLITEDELLQAKITATDVAILKFQQAKEEQLKNLTEIQEAAKKVSESMKSAISSAVADMIMDGKSFEAAMKSVFNTVLRTAIETFTRVAIEAAIARAAAGGITGSAGGVGAGLLVGGVAISMLKDFKFPKFQEGGIITQPTFGLIGEKGPEAVVPLNKSGLFGSVEVNIHQSNNMTVNGFGEEQTREIMRRISAATRSGAAEGAELVKSILSKQEHLQKVSV